MPRRSRHAGNTKAPTTTGHSAAGTRLPNYCRLVVRAYAVINNHPSPTLACRTGAQPKVSSFPGSEHALPLPRNVVAASPPQQPCVHAYPPKTTKDHLAPSSTYVPCWLAHSLSSMPRRTKHAKGVLADQQKGALMPTHRYPHSHTHADHEQRATRKRNQFLAQPTDSTRAGTEPLVASAHSLATIHECQPLAALAYLPMAKLLEPAAGPPSKTHPPSHACHISAF